MNLRENWRRSKEVLGAYFRQGFHELGAIFYGPGTVVQPPEYGMAATKTPGEVADGIRGTRGPSASRDEPGLLRQAMERANPEPQREDRQLERD